MDPKLCRQLNLFSLELLADYLSVDFITIKEIYDELLSDTFFLEELNEQISTNRRFYQGGIFKHKYLDSIDWFAIQRIILYVIVRLFKPEICLETGVFYGGSTCFILNALRRNKKGTLISIDLPGQIWENKLNIDRHHMVGHSEDIPKGLDIGFIVHKNLKEHLQLIEGNSLEEIPKINKTIDMYNHDSEHSFGFVKQEMGLVWDKLAKNSLIIADDIDWSNGFFSFCVEKKLYPLIITDNGKSGLRARNGLIQLAHPFNQKKDVVG